MKWFSGNCILKGDKQEQISSRNTNMNTARTICSPRQKTIKSELLGHHVAKLCITPKTHFQVIQMPPFWPMLMEFMPGNKDKVKIL